MLLVLVEGLDKWGAEHWGTGTDGSFAFGLNSGKAAHSISYCLFAWVLLKEQSNFFETSFMLPDRFSEGKTKLFLSAFCWGVPSSPACISLPGCLVLLWGMFWSPQPPAFSRLLLLLHPLRGFSSSVIASTFSFYPVVIHPMAHDIKISLSSGQPARGLPGDRAVAGGDGAILAVKPHGPSAGTLGEALATEEHVKEQSLRTASSLAASPLLLRSPEQTPRSESSSD